MKSNKIILASYPRSGNTFLRNILYSVYGMDSIGDVDVHSVEEWKDSDIVFIKTHELPNIFFKKFGRFPVVYLVRDGRDALVSQAYHRIQIIAPGDDYLQILRESIDALGGTYFGGWPKNVRQWSRFADVIIRFEDLIRDPQAQLSKLERIIDLPEADWTKLPTFEQLKKGEEQYVDRDMVTWQDATMHNRHALFFRKGKPGEWMSEMPKELQSLFWKKSATVMRALGYGQQGGLSDRFEDLEGKILKKGIRYSPIRRIADIFRLK